MNKAILSYPILVFVNTQKYTHLIHMKILAKFSKTLVIDSYWNDELNIDVIVSLHTQLSAHQTTSLQRYLDEVDMTKQWIGGQSG